MATLATVMQLALLAIPAARADTNPEPDRGSLVRVRLRAALRRLFADPEKILEVGIRRPPKEVEESRAELRRFFTGSHLSRIEVPEAAGDRAEEGRFSRVVSTLEGLTLMGMKIAEARFTLEGLRVDAERLASRGELEIEGLEAIGMAFRVDQEAVNAVTDSFAIGLGRGRFLIRGRKRLLLLPVGFRAEGLLAFTPEGEIHFRDRAMSLAGLPLPGMFRRALRKRINPVFDLAGYLGVAAEVFRVRFQSIRHHPGALELTARAQVLLEALAE